MKQCRKCGEVKSPEQFYAHPTTSDRKQSYCKVCAAGYARHRRTGKSEPARKRPGLDETEADKLKEAVEKAIAELEAGWSHIRLDAYLYGLRSDNQARHRARLHNRP